MIRENRGNAFRSGRSREQNRNGLGARVQVQYVRAIAIEDRGEIRHGLLVALAVQLAKRHFTLTRKTKYANSFMPVLFVSCAWRGDGGVKSAVALRPGEGRHVNFGAAHRIDRSAEIVGVNNRNLRTFEVTLDTSLRLADQIPPSVIRVSESGFETREQIQQLQDAGYTAFLIGEHLMRSGTPAQALQALTS